MPYSAHVTLPRAFTEVPPLENGDRLTRCEFERRYDASPEVKKAELVEGVVYVSSPVRLRLHGEPHSHVIWWLTSYKAATTGVLLGDNATVRLDLDNEPQPDVLLIVDPALGGQAKISDDDYVEGAPDLVAEIASSSASYDLGDKRDAYCRNGVREYVVWRVLEVEIDWYVLRGGSYEKLTDDADGITRSEAFPGLWLDKAAMKRGDLATVRQALEKGLATAEHTAFVERLKTSA